MAFFAKDGTFTAKTYSCTKGANSPTLRISCTHSDAGTIGAKGTVYVNSTDVASLGSSSVKMRASWWWNAIPTWQVVLSPWLAAIPDSWTTVVYAETTYHALPGTTSTKRTDSKEFSSTPELDYPDEYGAAYIGHVRVFAVDANGRAVSYPSEVGC